MIDLINDNPYTESGLSYDPVSGQAAPGNYGYKATTYGIFAEDTWKANRKLTINYGIRYDNFGNPYVALKGTVLANFHLSDGSDMADRVANGVMKQQSNVFSNDMNWIFSPRIGLAYDPFADNKWVVRGGIGLFHDLFTLGNAENGLKGNPPGFVVPTFYNNGSTAAPIFSYGTQNHYPFGFQYPAFVGQPLDAKGGIPGSQISVGGTAVSLSSPEYGELVGRAGTPGHHRHHRQPGLCRIAFKQHRGWRRQHRQHLLWRRSEPDSRRPGAASCIRFRMESGQAPASRRG